MNENFIKEWFNAICYPVPVFGSGRDVWEKFAEKATYSRVKQLFDEYKDICFTHKERENLRAIVKRLAKGNWPKLSDDFLERHKAEIFVVTSKETAKDEIQSCQARTPLYLVDKNNQMLGILVNKSTVVTGFIDEVVCYRVAEVYRVKSNLPNEEQMRAISFRLPDIKKKLDVLGLKLAKNYWVTNDYELFVGASMGVIRPTFKKLDCAQLLFVL
ncbi:MAG: hypothetical protein IKC10_07610 [Alphaproteobacteria bacterium]|nr:hypothetical protein [Alphaproteobacteria bacterium]